MIYYILNASENSVKIGTTKSPASLQKRLKTFKCANPGDLKIIHTETGDRFKEARMHREFQSLRRGTSEWFWYTGTLYRYLERVRQPEF